MLKREKSARKGKRYKGKKRRVGCRPEGNGDELWKAMDQWKLIRVSVHRKNQPTHSLSDKN